MRCVPLKSHEQLALQATHRVRQRFIVERTATVNQMRALLLEYRITVPVGRKVFERSLLTSLEDTENGLPDFIRAPVLRLRERWQQLDIHIDDMSLMLGQASSTSSLCQKNQHRPRHWTDCLNRVDCRDWQWLTIQESPRPVSLVGAGPQAIFNGRQIFAQRDQ